MAAYSVITPAAATYQNSQNSIMQILEHQRLQDERINALEKKVDKQGELLNSMNLSLAVVANRTDWMQAWIKSGGQK